MDSSRRRDWPVKTYATELGLDGEAFAVCLDSRAFQAEVQADTREACDAHVLGVPMFFFYGPGRDAVVLGAQPFATFRSLIDSLLRAPPTIGRSAARCTSPAKLLT